MVRLALILFLVQAGFHAYTASVPVALARLGYPDPEIGVIVGTTSVVQLPAALLMGSLLDRHGGRRILLLSAAAYLAASAAIAIAGLWPTLGSLPFVVARGLQGIAIAASLPAALALVSELVPPGRQSVGLAFVNSGHNLGAVVLPPLSLLVLDLGGLPAVATAAGGLILLGAATALRSVPRRTPAPATRTSDSLRRLAPAVHRGWVVPLAVLFFYIVHWGVVTAYLPARAERAGADVGLFFAADGLAVILSRVPSGWLTDRFPHWILVLAGLGVTGAGLGFLASPASDPGLVAAGLCTGLSGGLTMTPLLIELNRRATAENRGSALALYSATLAVGMLAGTMAMAPLVARFAFEGALAAAFLSLAVGALLALTDRRPGGGGLPPDLREEATAEVLR